MTAKSSIQARKDQGKAERENRIPLGTPRLKMTAPHREGFVRRWVNGTPQRIEQAKVGGWKFVPNDDIITGEDSQSTNSELGNAVSQPCGTSEGGQVVRSYLMEIRKDWYDEDQAAKQTDLDETDEALRQGRVGDTMKDNGYIPKEGIKINNMSRV